jgi:hypothetical protein
MRLITTSFATLAACSLTLGVALSAGVSGVQAAGKAPISIGIDAPVTGAFAPYQVGGIQFFQSYIDYVNAHGGIDGHHINVTLLDDKSDPGQALLNFESLWSQDHVLAVFGGFFATPGAYVQSNEIPLYGGGFGTNFFASHYTSIYTTGGQLPAWSAQTAYWITKILHRPVKRVAVMYNNAFDSGFLPFISHYWKKLGATFIDVVPDEGPTADCSAYVLKFKSENIQYIDEQALQNGNCIIAESRIGWKPPLGQGGPVTSEIGEAELIGKPYIGVVAGSPNTLYTGAPIYPHPSVVDRTFVGNIRKYYPSYATYNFLNGTTTIQSYGVAVLMVTAIKGTLEKYGKLTSALLNKYTRSMTNFDDGLQPIVKSFEPNCKTGGDGTIWGFWHYNPKPTATKPTLYMVPSSGPAWVTNTWLGVPKCYLTQSADRLFPNG